MSTPDISNGGWSLRHKMVHKSLGFAIQDADKYHIPIMWPFDFYCNQHNFEYAIYDTRNDQDLGTFGTSFSARENAIRRASELNAEYWENQ